MITMNGVLLEDEDLSDVDDHIFLNGNGDGKGDHGKDDLAKPLMPPRKKSQVCISIVLFVTDATSRVLS